MSSTPAPPPATPPTSRRTVRVLVGIGVALLLLVGGLVTWGLLRSPGPDDVVEDYLTSRSCDEAKELAHPELRKTFDEPFCETFESFYDDFDYTYEIGDVEIDGDEATVRVSEEGDARDPDLEDFENDVDYQLTRVDGDWLIRDFEFLDEEQ